MNRLYSVFDKILSKFLPLSVIAGATIIIFRDFLFSGEVMDGEYDRRNNILPYYFIFMRAFKNMEIPQWNPYLFCGNSLFSNSTYVYFYPPNWIIWAASETAMPYVTTALLMLHFVLAGYFMWLLAHEISGERYWSSLATLGYMLSSALMMGLFTNTEQFLVFVYGPLLLYLMLSSEKRSRLAGYLLQTTAAAFLLLGGQVQFVIYLVGIIGMFALYKALFIRDNGGAAKDFFVSCASLATGALISAIRLLPFYMATRDNALVKMTYADFLRVNKTPPESVMKLFLPELFPWINKGEYFNAYSGIVAAFIALYALVFVWNRKSMFWKLTPVGIALMVTGTPLAYVHYFLLAKSNLAFGRMAVLVPMLVSALTAYTGRMIAEEPAQLRRFIKFAVISAFSVMATAMIFYFSAQPRPEIAQLQMAEMRAAIIHFVVFSAILVVLFVSVRISQNQKTSLFFRAGLLLLAATDLFIIANTDINSQNPAFIAGPFYRSTEQEQQAAESFRRSGRNLRVLGFGEGTSYNRTTHLDLYGSSGFESVPPYYITMLYGYPSVVPRESARHISPATQRTVELSSTRYVLEIEQGFEVPSSLPRYSLYYDHVSVEDDRAALSLLLDDPSKLDIHKTVLLDREPEISVTGTPGSGSIEMHESGFNDIEFRVTTSSNAILLLTDTFDEGWTAKVDGMPVPVMRANYAFRAVAVPAGSHDIKFSFTHKGFKAGKTVSIFSLSVFFVITGVQMYRTSGKRSRPVSVSQ